MIIRGAHERGGTEGGIDQGERGGGSGGEVERLRQTATGLLIF
jgi:hypothetical protein